MIPSDCTSDHGAVSEHVTSILLGGQILICILGAHQKCCHKHSTHEVWSGPRVERCTGTACTLGLQHQLLHSNCTDHPPCARHSNSAYQDIQNGAAQSYSATTSPSGETIHISLNLYTTDKAAPAKLQSKRQENTSVLVPVELPVSLCQLSGVLISFSTLREFVYYQKVHQFGMLTPY